MAPEQNIHGGDWGSISEALLGIIGRRADKVLTDSRWRSADWASIEPITDLRIVAQLRDLAAQWATVVADDEATDPDRTIEHMIVNRVVPMGYLLGRILVETSEDLFEYSPEQVRALIEEFNWIDSSTDDYFLPDIGLDAINQLTAEVGFPEHEGLFSTAWIAYNCSLLIAILEYERRNRDPNLDAEIAVAFSTDTSPAELSKLVGSASFTVRAEVASNSKTPADALFQLARDPDKYIRRRVAKRRSLDPGTLELLSRDPDSLVRSNVGINRNTALDDVEALARDGSLDARIGAIYSGRLSLPTLEALVRDRSWRVRQVLAASQNAPELLEAIANDKDERVRAHVAWNRATPRALLDRLANDPSALVRDAVVSAKTL